MGPNGLYSFYATRQDIALQAGMDAVLQSLLGGIRPSLQFGLLVYVVAAGFAVAYGRMSGDRYATWFIRALAISWLLAGTAAYGPVIRNLMFDEIPNWIASMVNGSTSRITAAQQFDVLSAASTNMVADVYAKTSGWSLSGMGQRMSAEAAHAFQDMVLGLQFISFMLSRRLLVLAICIGPPLLIFELFEATRGFVRHWIGVLVGLCALQLASAVQLQISLRGAMQFLQMMRANPGEGLDAQVAGLWDIGIWFLLDAIAMFSIPTICAVGSGVGAHMAAGSSAVTGLASKATGIAGKAVSKGGKAISGAAGKRIAANRAKAKAAA